ncbi:OmpH family outer membrane protein [Neolewinella agarilytica]|uniref:Periplasmic chaperone for outer membrane proteins Skp n=1 Tax=Neolewinella agarilytica TaxID=478744 RepID=A0A1H9AUR1_9BACT|nr:OmpH family outer membrane protein [Neolewinella agarilytica]SEP80231.1 periplasmic chaperone for outer membrane proteins Skp [Neolewinella agarilytica]
MKKFLQIAMMAVLVFAATATASAQKFGYVNSAEILAELPAMKAAESNLEGLQKQLQKKGQAMVQNFETDYRALQEKAQAGELTPKAQQEEATKLETRQKEIAAFEQQMVADLQKKRAELLEPIYKSVNDAIAAVAKEKGYQFIFDQQVLLFGEETADVSADVKTKLGL